MTKVTATAGSKAPYSIGAGASGSCGTVTIEGTVTGNITASPYTYTPGSGAPTGTIDLSTLTSDVVARAGNVLTGTLGANVKISIGDGAIVTLDGVTINARDDNWAAINCEGDAVIVLADGTVSNISGGYRMPGIHVPEGKTLTIRGSGSLNASSSGFGAGIGCGYKNACGNIVIEGGNITATGAKYAPGIGCGYGAKCGNITINGGTVNATGGHDGAGIGSGFYGSTCGDITITNGVTSVTATKGRSADHSIGRGNGGWCGTVTIGGKEGTISQSPYTYKP